MQAILVCFVFQTIQAQKSSLAFYFACRYNSVQIFPSFRPQSGFPLLRIAVRNFVICSQLVRMKCLVDKERWMQKDKDIWTVQSCLTKHRPVQKHWWNHRSRTQHFVCFVYGWNKDFLNASQNPWTKMSICFTGSCEKHSDHPHSVHLKPSEGLPVMISYSCHSSSVHHRCGCSYSCHVCSVYIYTWHTNLFWAAHSFSDSCNLYSSMYTCGFSQVFFHGLISLILS